MPARLMAALCVLFVGAALSPAEEGGAKEGPPKAAPRDPSLLEGLRDSPYRILHEAYHGGSWDIWERKADGSEPRNLTRTSDVHELYPQVSPDGRRIAFVADGDVDGEYQRSVCIMRRDGSERELVARNARQPCWSPDGRTLAYLPGEYPRFDVTDFVSKGLVFYDVEEGETRPHPNAKIHHLYNPSWSADGEWIVATVHGGMGFGHAILAIEVGGDRVHDLGIGGCRPDLSRDGKRIAWGLDDHTIAVADIDFSGPVPEIANQRVLVRDEQHLYHADWSPDGKLITFSRGPGGRQKASGPGTHRGLAEFVGVRAVWDLGVVRVDGGTGWAPLSSDGAANKESEWALPAPAESAR